MELRHTIFSHIFVSRSQVLMYCRIPGAFIKTDMSRAVRKPVFEIATRPDTNWTILPQKLARRVKFRIRKYRDCIICEVKTKWLISCAVSMQLICAFLFTYMD